LQRQYKQSVYQAAVKQPGYRHQLAPIDTPGATVTVVHFQHYPTLDDTRYTWVALPTDLKAACRGKPDPVLALEQILGLPPEQRPDWRLVEFDVAKTRLFRPCISDQSITTTSCDFDVSKSAPSGAAAETERFVFSQAVTSYRAGFDSEAGYPFTGMGWSYDWNPDAPLHHGISEYVVKPGEPAVSDITSTTPGEFCGVR
jgi:hypothetical protein